MLKQERIQVRWGIHLLLLAFTAVAFPLWEGLAIAGEDWHESIGEGLLLGTILFAVVNTIWVVVQLVKCLASREYEKVFLLLAVAIVQVLAVYILFYWIMSVVFKT